MTLEKHPKTLLVIVAEAALENTVLRDAQARGAQSWTITEVHGAGREGVREGRWEADRTVEIKLLCSEQVADAIASHLIEAYAPHYSVSMYFMPVSVLRPERY